MNVMCETAGFPPLRTRFWGKNFNMTEEKQVLKFSTPAFHTLGRGIYEIFLPVRHVLNEGLM